jgi:hypothetical protein
MKILSEEEALQARAKLENELKNIGEEVVESSPEEYKDTIRRFYSLMDYVLDYYMDLPKETKNLVILWTLGTYYHEHFPTFPYLFLNAMRSSGKTRLLKIIETFCYKGQLTMSMTEAVLFRTVGTLLLDEFEGVNRKGQENLRELLNSAYKKGMVVSRMRKKKTLDGEAQVKEDFKPYRPIAIANIWGMEEVLGDRCINLHIEKSSDSSKTKLVEDFTNFQSIQEVKKMLENQLSVVMCSVVTSGNVYSNWNKYVKEHITTSYTYNTFNTYNYTKLHEKEVKIKETEKMLEGKVVRMDYINIFDKIYGSEIDGRHLELFFPLFIIASEVDDEILNYTIESAIKIVKEKKIDEVVESKDVGVYSLVAKQTSGQWYDVNELTTTFKWTIGEGENEWLNAKWLGRALKRLSLVKDKRRTAKGIQVILDVPKAIEKEKIFKP